MDLINKIFWKRTYLFIEYFSSSGSDLCLRNRESGRTVMMESNLLKDNYYRAKLNITIANGRDLLEPGSWEIIEANSSEPVPCSECIKSDPYIGQRIFRYTQRFYSYAFRLVPFGSSVTIDNSHYRSVNRAADEITFQKNFFN